MNNFINKVIDFFKREEQEDVILSDSDKDKIKRDCLLVFNSEIDCSGLTRNQIEEKAEMIKFAREVEL